MHTCLSFSNIDGHHWDTERPISDLLARLDAYCSSIDWCNIAVQGPSGEGNARCWRVDVKLRVFDETVRAASRIPEDPDAAQSLSRALGEVYAEATAQIATIAAQRKVPIQRAG